ncbi:MAG: hypothetical protein ABUL68_03230, partial [Pseudomonadota bacterium]
MILTLEYPRPSASFAVSYGLGPAEGWPWTALAAPTVSIQTIIPSMVVWARFVRSTAPARRVPLQRPGRPSSMKRIGILTAGG